MISFAQLWVPILLSAIGVFIASSIVHMLLKFWHMPDYRGFANEDEVRAAIRNGKPEPGMYVVPHCSMEAMKQPEVKEKFRTGPVGFMILRPSGVPALGKSLVLWFVFCLVVSCFCALVSLGMPADAGWHRVFHTIGLAAFMAYALSALPMGIWWGQPWKAVAKDAVDGLIYALVTAGVFVWLWPQV
jgi:hypothetical protein